MNIGEAARASGVSAKMLRYYESIGLVPQAGRTAAGYRVYGGREVDILRFIRRARGFGMPMDRVKLLVGLWQDTARPSREVKRIAIDQVAQLDARVGELTAMRDALAELARGCRGDDRPDCPILRDLAGAAQPGAAQPAASGRAVAGRTRFGSLAASVTEVAQAPAGRASRGPARPRTSGPARR